MGFRLPQGGGELESLVSHLKIPAKGIFVFQRGSGSPREGVISSPW